MAMCPPVADIDVLDDAKPVGMPSSQSTAPWHEPTCAMRTELKCRTMGT
jgi:hypothetical protein